jgi:hypothetical protein
MHYIISIILIVTLSFVIFFFAKREARKAEKTIDADSFIIRLPKINLKLYIFVTIFFFLIYGFSLLGLADGGDIERWWVFLLAMLPFMLLGPFLIILWYRWKIIVKGNQIIAMSYFGKEKIFSFDYITTVKNGVNFTRFGKIDYIKAYHEGKKLFTVTAICTGYQILVSRLNDRNSVET